MVMILGIEVPSLFECHVGKCNQSIIDQELDRYYARGIRYIFPVQAIDNAFGGAALFTNFYNIVNKEVNGTYFNLIPCEASGFSRNQVNFDGNFTQLQRITNQVVTGSETAPNYPPSDSGYCNSRGLTPLGEYLIRGLMRRGMFVDIDHMSAVMVRQVRQIAQAENYPLMSSHSGFIDLYESRAEHLRTSQDVESIRDTGGVIGPISHQKKFNEAYRNPDECPGSSRSFATVFRYLKGFFVAKDLPPAIAIGTDANGYALVLGPRFGDEACEGGSNSQANPVTYPFDSLDKNGYFTPLKTGDRTFDYNTEGLATVALLPEFTQDLGRTGMHKEDLTDFFNSAEQFIRAWEKIEAR
ncbi:MAG: membrane dipeptidase [Pseudobacteriovorax sp.]|nr:membrane dipeptidase [Pseudobacteriovorax sp.]